MVDDLLTQLRCMQVYVRTNINPARWLIAYHEDDYDTLIEALKSKGVRDDELSLFSLVDWTHTLDPGKMLVLDREETDRLAREAIGTWTFGQ